MSWNSKFISDKSLAQKIYHERNPQIKKEDEEFEYQRRRHYCPRDSDKEAVKREIEERRKYYDTY